MALPPVQTIRMTPPQTVTAFAVSTGAVEVDIVSTLSSTGASLGVSPVTYGLTVTPSWVTTWWLSNVTANSWALNFTVPAPNGGTLTVSIAQINTIAVTSGGWTSALPVPPPPPPPPPVTVKQLYGVHGDWAFFGAPAYQTNAAAQCVNLGVQVMRSSLLMDKVQGTQGSFTWAQPDATVAQCVANKITPLFYLGGSASWANSNLGRWGIPTYPSAAFNTWVTTQATWMAVVAARYSPVGNIQVPMFEIWNEPNQSYTGSYWMPNGGISLPSVNAYIQLAEACVAAIKAVNPAILVGVGSPTNLNMNDGNSNCVPGISWNTSIMTAGVAADAMTCHPYAGGPGSSLNPATDNYPSGNSFKDIGRMLTAMNSNGNYKSLWVTEYADWGGVSQSTQGGYINTALGLLQNTYSVHVLGTSVASVTASMYFAQRNGNNGTSDTDSAGLYTGLPYNGPNTIQTTGTNFKAFMATNPL